VTLNNKHRNNKHTHPSIYNRTRRYWRCARAGYRCFSMQELFLWVSMIKS